MVRRASGPGADNRAATTAEGAPADTDKPVRRARRKAAGEGDAKPATVATGGKGDKPSFATSQQALPEPPPAEPQRPAPEVAAASTENTFEGNLRAASLAAGQAYGAVRDTILKGADRVGELASEDGLKQAADTARDVAGRNKGVLVAGAALVVGGLPAAAVTLGAAARAAKLTLVDGADPVAAGKQVIGEINGLAQKAPEHAAELAGQAAEIAGQAKELLSGWAARFGIKKKD